MRSVVILGLQVRLGTLLVPSAAVDTGAVLAGLGGLDREAVLGELGVAAHVDARHVPEDGVAAFGIFELQDIVLAGGGGQLDGHATAVAVGLKLFRVGAAARREGLHVSSTTRDGPRVDVLPQFVENLHAAAAATAGLVTSLDGHGVGEGRSESGQGGEETELGEHHFESGSFGRECGLEKNVVVKGLFQMED